MTPLYYIYGPQGFWGSGTFTSDREAAKEFTYDQAVEFCKRRLGAAPGLQYYPLPKVAVLAVHSK